MTRLQRKLTADASEREAPGGADLGGPSLALIELRRQLEKYEGNIRENQFREESRWQSVVVPAGVGLAAFGASLYYIGFAATIVVVTSILVALAFLFSKFLDDMLGF